jgi:putative flippase GtrA
MTPRTRLFGVVLSARRAVHASALRIAGILTECGRNARRTSDQMLTFLVFGLGAVAIHYGSMAILILVGVPAVAASQTGFVAGGAFSYATNRSFTFRSSARHRRAIPRFLGVSAICFVVNGVGLALTLRLGAPTWFAQLCATGAVTCCSFLLHRIWTFRD